MRKLAIYFAVHQHTGQYIARMYDRDENGVISEDVTGLRLEGTLAKLVRSPMFKDAELFSHHLIQKELPYNGTSLHRQGYVPVPEKDYERVEERVQRYTDRKLDQELDKELRVQDKLLNGHWQKIDKPNGKSRAQ